MEEGIKMLIFADCEVTDAGCQVIADIVKVNDTMGELDLPKNTKSSKKYKIMIRGSAETVEKAKTIINNIAMYYHDEMTHPDEVHEEYVVQLPWLWDFAHPERLQGQDVLLSGILRRSERCNCGREERWRSCSPISHEAPWEALWWRGWWNDPGDRRWWYWAQQVVKVPVHQILKETVEVDRSIPHERVVGQIIDKASDTMGEEDPRRFVTFDRLAVVSSVIQSEDPQDSA